MDKPTWMPIETAPYETPVLVKVAHMTFEAMLKPDAAENEEGSCDQWVACHEGEHPPCWTDGACWQSNADEIESLQPVAWMPLPVPPQEQQP